MEDCQYHFSAWCNKSSARSGDRRQGLAPMTAAEHTTDPVPLYLVPQALSAEIHRLGGSILEVHIRRTGCHNYLIILTTRGK